MSEPPDAGGPAVLDTNVVSYLFLGAGLGEAYRALVAGRPALVSCQTVAELDRWPLENRWGERRRAELEAHLAGFTALPHTRA